MNIGTIQTHATKMATRNSNMPKGKINAAIDHAMKTVGLESLKRGQREAIQEFLSLCFVANGLRKDIPVLLFATSTCF